MKKYQDAYAWKVPPNAESLNVATAFKIVEAALQLWVAMSVHRDLFFQTAVRNSSASLVLLTVWPVMGRIIAEAVVMSKTKGRKMWIEQGQDANLWMGTTRSKESESA